MFHSKILSPKIGAVTIEYSEGEARVQKTFPNESKAKRFYKEKLMQNKEPKIVKAVIS